MSINARQLSINSSPEFEFSTTSTNNDLLPADQLFSHGQILPLDHHTAVTHRDSSPNSSTPSTSPNPNPNLNPKLKKWKKLFTSHHTAKGNAANANGTASLYSHSAISQHELNIHIWPFSRSRSSGNTNSNGGSTGLARSRSIRKSISAPCSRNNSQGHDAACSTTKINGKKWGSLTGGIHVGRNMPVFQLKRKKATANLNIDDAAADHRCRVEEDKGSVVNGEGDQNTVTGDRGSLFNLRSIFSKKLVY